MGSAPRQVGAAKTVVNKAYDDGLVSAETVQVFKRVKKLLKRNSNARDTVLTIEQIESLMGALPHHTKTIMATAFYTGMRRGEILSLTWDKVNLEKKVIRLEAGDTKDREPRTIPISKELFPILAAIPRALHDNHVFLYKGKPVRDIRTGLIVACKTAGIPYGRFTKNGLPRTVSSSTTSGIPLTPICERPESQNRSSWKSPATRPGRCSTGTIRSITMTDDRQSTG